jgi:hypothetical protein
VLNSGSTVSNELDSMQVFVFVRSKFEFARDFTKESFYSKVIREIPRKFILKYTHEQFFEQFFSSSFFVSRLFIHIKIIFCHFSTSSMFDSPLNFS